MRSGSTLVSEIRSRMDTKSSDELLEIWKTNDRSQWSDDAFAAVREILISRQVNVPEQQTPSVLNLSLDRPPENVPIYADDTTTKGIGGCLLYLCIILIVVSPAAITYYTVSFWTTLSPYFDRYSSLTMAVIIEAVGLIGLAAASLFAGYGLCIKTRNAVRFAKSFLVGQLIFSFIIPWAFYWLSNYPHRQPMRFFGAR